MNSPKVSIVILNFNGQKYLEKFLPFLVKTKYENYEIVIADNASSDNSVEFINSHYPQLKLKINSKNSGFAGGYNWALQDIEADYFVLLNSDVEVTENWLLPLIKLLESNEKIAIAQPKLLDYYNRNKFEYAGAAGGWLDIFGYPFAKGRVFSTCEEDNNQYNLEEPIFWASGAALCIKSSVFFEVGGFDDSFFAHQEEIDLSWRVQLKGYFVYSCPSSIIFHIGGGTLQKGRKKIFLNFRNNLFMLAKNLILKEKLVVFPARICLDFIFAFYKLFTLDFDHFISIFKAHISFYKNILTNKIKKTANRKPLHQLLGIYPKLIIISYYFLNKKIFVALFKNNSVKNKN